ncbi:MULTISPECIES: hypothetical protein [Butyrivibrio]|nr:MULTISPECIES: hypothetical protein [Butyrivibrio]SEQ36198.1 hypothetical protein SAMN02910382_02764 [Butyrivibrio sp. TB]
MSLKDTIKRTSLFKALNEYRWREHMTHPGSKYPDKTFYVIRRHDMYAGLFSFVATNIASIKLCLDNGYVPVIDMKSSRNSLLLPGEVGKINAWDRLYDQPFGFDLDDVKMARNVILGSIHPPENFPDYRMLEDEDELKMWNELGRKYVRDCMKAEDIQKTDDYMKENFGVDGRVLAVVARGTDYISKKPWNHPIQPDVKTMIEDAKKLMEEKECDYLYLATEDNAIWDMFEEAFPGKLYSYQKQHYDVPDGKYIADVANDIQAPLERNREYLISILIVSKCNCLLAGASGGTYGALLMTDGYEYKNIYNLGRYK